MSGRANKVRMLVLEVDEPHPKTQDKKSSFGQILNVLLARAGEEHEPKLEIETVMQYIIEPKGGGIPRCSDISRDVHAVLVSGSMHNAHRDEAWVLKLLELIKGTWARQGDEGKV